MNNFNNNDEPQETVRQTLERVWHEKEQPEQSSYVARNPLARGLPRETYIKSDRNYAWTNAHKYDHRPDNIWAQIHNFLEISCLMLRKEYQLIMSDIWEPDIMITGNEQKKLQNDRKYRKLILKINFS